MDTAKQKILINVPTPVKNKALDISTDRKKRSLPKRSLGDVYVEALERGLELMQNDSELSTL